MDKVIRGAGWAAIAGYIQLVSAFFGNIMLARILLPEDFGTFALASSLLTFLFMFAGFGSQEAVIQCRDEAISELIPTAFWFTLAIALGLSLIGLVISNALRNFYSNEVISIVNVLILVKLLDNVGLFFSAILKRDLYFKPIAQFSILAVFSSFLLAGIAAWLGAGSWALVLREVSAVLIRLLGLYWVSNYRIRFKFNWPAARWIWSFGWRMMFSRITEVIFGRFDNFVVGTLLGTISLGHYTLSYRLAFLGQQLTQGAIQPVVLAAFSRVQQSTQKLKYGFERLNYWLWRVTLPLGLSVALVGEELVVWIYGDKWQLAGQVFQSMFLFLALLPVYGSVKQFLIGSGHLGLVVKTQLIQLGFFVPGVIAAAVMGNLFTVVWIVNISLLLSWWLMSRFACTVAAIDWVYVIKAPLLAVAASSAVGLGCRALLDNEPKAYVFIGLQLVSVFVIYLASLFILEYESLRGEVDLIRARIVH